MKRMIISVMAMGAYGLMGLIERGWFDWQGMLTVGLLIIALSLTIPKKRKAAK